MIPVVAMLVEIRTVPSRASFCQKSKPIRPEAPAFGLMSILAPKCFAHTLTNARVKRSCPPPQGVRQNYRDLFRIPVRLGQCDTHKTCRQHRGRGPPTAEKVISKTSVTRMIGSESWLAGGACRVCCGVRASSGPESAAAAARMSMRPERTERGDMPRNIQGRFPQT